VRFLFSLRSTPTLLHLFTSECALIQISVRILIDTLCRFAHVTPPMKTLTQRLLAAAPLALVAACGSTPPSGSTAANGEPMIYASSARSASSVASCLEDRLPHVHASRDGNTTELSVGSRSDASYFVTLTPNGPGSVIRVMHGASDSNDPPEEELRFDVARCAT
jgi:hypothetical protein